MLDSVIIVGVVVTVTAILSVSFAVLQTTKGELYQKLITLLITGGFMVLNGVAFGDDALSASVIMGYLKDGLVLGAAASGLYDMGEAAMNAKAEAKAEFAKKTKIKSEK